MAEFNRRTLLLTFLLAANFASHNVLASDDDSGDDSDNSDSGSSNSGSGSSNSGSGSGGDDDSDDDKDDDDGGNNFNGRNESHGGDDHERAIKAVKKGKAVSLQKLKDHLSRNYPGKILNVGLRRRSGDYFYNVRILGKGNRIRVLTLNALTLKLRSN